MSDESDQDSRSRHLQNSGDSVKSPKEEELEGVDYGYTGAKKFVHENLLSLPPNKWVRGDWDIHICQTCCKKPGYYLAGCCCAPCYVFYQRKALLGDRMNTEYSFCQGAYGKCWCTPCCRWKFCPLLCLLLESCCCTSCGVSGNRKEMQKIYPTVNTWTECCLLWTGTIMSFLGYFGSCITCLTNGCLNSQQENEWIKEEGYTGLTPYCQWEGAGGHLCACCSNKCEPCCGEPCNVPSGLYCFLCWFCCCACSASKLLAAETDQPCAVLNHFGSYVAACLWASCGAGLLGTIIPCLLPLVPILAPLPCCALNAIQRHNLRFKANIGRDQDWFGDILIANCCLTAPCGICQTLRTVPADSWDWLGDIRKNGCNFSNDEWRFLANQAEVYVPGKNAKWESQPIPPLCPCMGGDDDQEGEEKPKRKKETKKEVAEEEENEEEDKMRPEKDPKKQESEEENGEEAKKESDSESESESKSKSEPESESESESDE